jgi:hypothetical protein
MPVITKENFIQWKGTNICMDFYCKCGYDNHYDGYFAYFVQCSKCSQIYKMAQSIEMEEVDTAAPHDPLKEDFSI